MRRQFKLSISMGVTALVTIVCFQNCSRVSFQQDVTGGISNKTEAFEPDQTLVGLEEQVGGADGEVLLPIPDSPTSMYVCPEGTQSSAQVQPQGYQSFATGTSSGSGPVSVSTFATSDGTKNTAGVEQTGDKNFGYIYQRGPINEGNIVQNGIENNACIVQIGDSNQAGITQTGERNSAGVSQTGGQSSNITQNGPTNSIQSAEECGCRVVDCDNPDSSSKLVCSQGFEQQIISNLNP